MSFTLPLSADSNVSLVGGKARNLGLMMLNHVPVPKGFVVTCAALQEFLKENTLDIATCKPEDIIGGTMPASIEEEIINEHAKCFSNGELVAVRSSGISEDSKEHSFSGMFSSFLNTSKDQLIQKIKECWASARNERVVQYSQVTKSNTNPLMGVVVQEMVESVAAGVIFTMNPVTMDQSYFVINAAPGLGESLVSGHITPDTFICNKETGELTSQHINSSTPSLTPEVISSLLELARSIQQVFPNSAQDIEFAWDGKTVWAVQSRPITTASAHSASRRPPDLSKSDICCNHETVDVFPEVITPLTWGTFDFIVHHSIQQRYKQKNIDFPADCSMYELHWGRVYQNLTVADMMVQAEFGFNPDQSTQALRGDLWKAETKPSTIPLMERVKGLMRLISNLMDSTATVARVTQVIADCSAWCKEKEKELKNTSELTIPEMQALIKSAMDRFCAFGCDYIDINVRLQIFYHATEVFLESAAKTLGEKIEFYLASLLTDLGGVETFEMNKHLRRLADLASKEEPVMSFLQSGDTDHYKEGFMDTNFESEFDAFLDNYGYRAINELDAASTRWGEDPTFLVDQLKVMAQFPQTVQEGQTGEEKRKRMEELLLSKVPFLQRYLTRWTIGKLQDYTRLRENAKCVLVRFISLSRHYLQRVAANLTARGILNQRDDVFYMSLSELEKLMAIQQSEETEAGERVRAMVKENAAQMERQKKLAYPELFVGAIPRFASKPDSDDQDALKGMGASCGVVQGIARILHSPHDRAKLQSKSDILVCSTTDPAWTPLFACCSGLVTVHGGMLSHGAIVAREFGIPAVLGVSNALVVLKDGMLINVDGDKGVVTVIANKEGESTVPVPS